MSVLGLVGRASVAGQKRNEAQFVSVWQHIKLSKQICPGHTLFTPGGTRSDPETKRKRNAR